MSPATDLFRPYLVRHANLRGIGDERPTALEIVHDLKAEGTLKDAVILITGCSAGLGIETARALYLTGAKLYLTFRNIEKGQAAIKAITADAPNGQDIEFLNLDLGDLESVRSAAADFKSRSDRLNILINNAGVMAAPQGKTGSGFETHMGSNHFGHFLLFELLKPVLLSSASSGCKSRVINLSSSGHLISPVRFDDMEFAKKGSYDPYAAYGQSKTANIYMANYIDRVYGSQGIRAVSVHPGVILSTELMRHQKVEDLQSIGDPEYFKKIECSAGQGAATTVWAALSPYFENHGGLYLAEVGVAPALTEDEGIGRCGYAPYAYDEVAEDRLWEISLKAVGIMPRQRKKLPFVCFAPEGELHSDCQNEPFSNDATFHADDRNKIWIGYRNNLDTSYNGSMTFRQVLAQAEVNLLQAMSAKPNSNQRAQWLEAFPGVATKASDHVVQQLERGERAFKQATCPNALCRKGDEVLQMEWIPIKSNASSSKKSAEGFLVGYIFRLQGQEMISICRNYYFDLYRFQRDDGTISPDMFLRTVQSDSSPQTAAKPGSRASSRKSMKRQRRSVRLQSSEALDDEGSENASSDDDPSTTTARATEGNTVPTSPGILAIEPAQVLEDGVHDKGEEVVPASTVVGPLPTRDEYTWMICQICHTYGVRALTMPNIASHIRTLEQATREDKRLVLCQSFAKIMTILVTTTSANPVSDFLDEEYENVVNAAVAEFGMDLLSRNERTIFMERMGRAMIAGQSEDLDMAYAALRASMIAYAGRK
ncbi:NAD(P)-binding protein, partial [Aureobasidium melanogenum]